MSTIITTNVIICYFHPDSSGLATAFKDKRQTSFLLQFLKALSPQDIECRPNWLEITCNRQIAESEAMDINQKLQEALNDKPRYQPLRNCQIMLKITFELCRLLEGVEYIRDQYRDGQVGPSQIDSYLLQISQQIKAISPTNNIKNDLFVLHPPPKKILEKNKRRISITDRNETQITDVASSKALDKATALQRIQRSDLMDKKQCKPLFYHISKATRTYLPVPSDDMYPIELYNHIEHSRSDLVRYDYNTNNNSNEVIYPNDTKYAVTLQDFADRKFHLNNNLVKKWITDRAYLMEKMDKLKENESEDDEKEQDRMNAIFRKFAIVDVRCHDFVGGNIPYAYKVEYDGFESKTNDLLKALEHESDVIFHCMYSQHRGPRAAYWYWRERRKWENKYKYKLYIQRVWVLDGGFKQWISDYVLDSDLVCNFDAKYWEDEYFPLTGREFFYRNDWKPQQTD